MAPTASPGTARLPRNTSAASRIPLVESQKPVTDAPAGAPPWFRVVSVTVSTAPAPLDGGTVKALIMRSAPIRIDRASALLLSNVSPIVPAASARAITYQVPPVTPAGITSTVDAL